MLRLVVRKLSCGQTNRHTAENIHLAMLRRWVITLSTCYHYCITVVERERRGLFTVLCRDGELLSSSSSAADLLHCLDVVSELSAGFDTSSSVSTGSQSSPLSRTGMLIFSVVVVMDDCFSYRRWWWNFHSYPQLTFNFCLSYLLFNRSC